MELSIQLQTLSDNIRSQCIVIDVNVYDTKSTYHVADIRDWLIENIGRDLEISRIPNIYKEKLSEEYSWAMEVFYHSTKRANVILVVWISDMYKRMEFTLRWNSSVEWNALTF